MGFKLAEVPEAFRRVEAWLSRGLFVAGFFSYEAGYAMEEKLFSPRSFPFPLLIFGCFKAPSPLTPVASAGRGGWSIAGIRTNISKEKYFGWINAIKKYIEAGDTYQITICLKLLFSFQGDARGLYEDLKRIQPVPYGAYLDAPPYRIASLSPEMFVRKQGSHLTTKPMKGTWPRSRFWLRDRIARWSLKHSVKNRAENLMITDLMRNDLGRVGSNIEVPVLFEVTPYRTLHQMTSTVVARVDPDISLMALFKAVFPSGSVTGAPKIRSMEIIRELEEEDRKVYTGAIGYITPQRDLFFNVPIRTLILDGDRGEMGIGGGIVWDSTAEGEWEETRLKAQFLFDATGLKSGGVFGKKEARP